MKTKYQYIYFRKRENIDVKQNVPHWEFKSRSSYDCINRKSDDKLGHVSWHHSWKQYCYYPTARAVYSTGCLSDIVDFISQLS